MTEPRRSVKAGRLEHLVWCKRRSPEHAGGVPPISTTFRDVLLAGTDLMLASMTRD